MMRQRYWKREVFAIHPNSGIRGKQNSTNPRTLMRIQMTWNVVFSQSIEDEEKVRKYSDASYPGRETPGIRSNNILGKGDT
jgi:hypothetical protein